MKIGHAFRHVNVGRILSDIGRTRLNARVRNADVDVCKIESLHACVLRLRKEDASLRQMRNDNARELKQLLRAGNELRSRPDHKEKLISKGKEIRQDIHQLEAKLRSTERELLAEASRVPNETHRDVPIGGQGSEVVLRRSGAAPPSDGGEARRDHSELCAMLDLADFEAGSSVTGSKFVFLKNEAAMMEMALQCWATSMAMARGYTPITTPDMVRSVFVEGCGFQPRGESAQVYHVEGEDLCLVGTSEVPLAAQYANRRFHPEALPLKLVGVSHCFRKEAGQGAKDSGLYRLHQFTKVELFAFAEPEQSEHVHHEMVQLQEEMYAKLGLPYRVLDMPTEELGAPAYRKFDIEAWMPGKQTYGEICSTSNCTDYQSRRLNIRYNEPSNGESKFVHTINGTACAIPRVILSILENHQDAQGAVHIPEVLHPYMGGITRISPKPPGVAGPTSYEQSGGGSWYMNV